MAVIKANGRYFHSKSDMHGRCPYCSGAMEKIGEITIDGTSHDIGSCVSCKSISGMLDGGLRSFVEDIQESNPTSSIGFIATTAAATTSSDNSTSNYTSNGNSFGYGTSNSSVELGSSSKGHLQNIDSSMMTLNSSLSNLSQLRYDMQNVVSAINNLSSVVSGLAQQNNTLMEKLATDPLNGIRKAVNSFNLE